MCAFAVHDVYVVSYDGSLALRCAPLQFIHNVMCALAVRMIVNVRLRSS